ncbi:DUF58 domain-containing protein [Pedobacter xixiisoli]|uniref:DUF58 domain-containing protein n=1 Tax=Pedobacter xixiisoli TaxID=1476464 RepID=A0A285ZQP4_9SPHI|nr:DUF58 domain-containing protein [Pedobacter xixiisoli]SOD11981.1 Protein of unknown function DUF58 [Pedobacter xixiisoli]
MSKLLDPKILLSIKQLSLAAKTTVNGFMNGINKSNVKGAGMEFSQYRSYQPGDDLRSLDWKMFARSDRYYIRESEVETNISLRLLIDASASMNHSDGNLTKINYAKYVAASLAYLANLQGDAVGLYVFKEAELFVMNTRQDFQHLSRLFHQLESIEANGSFTNPIGYKEIFSGGQKKELLVFITDFYQADQELIQLLDTLLALKHEIIVFQLLAENELKLDFKGYTTFEDLETKQTIQIDQGAVRTSYQQKMDTHLANIKTQMLDRKIYYRTLTTNQPIDQALRDFLKQRHKVNN